MDEPRMEPCCADLDNRVPAEVGPDAPEGLTLEVCSVCGRRHFELSVDPVEVGVKVEAAG